MRIEIPLKTTNTLNAREHWSARSRRVKRERAAVTMAWRSELTRMRREGQRTVTHLPAIVLLTRLSPGTLDSDGLLAALKGVRDQVAAELGCGDSPSDPIVWQYAQTKCRRGEYGVRIEIRPHASGCPACASGSLEHPERCECRCHLRNRSGD